MATDPGDASNRSKRLRRLLLLRIVPALFAALLCVQPPGAAADTAQPRSEAVMRTVYSLLGYARWPVEREVLRLCVDSSARYAGKLSDGGTLASGRPIQSRRIDVMAAGSMTGCDSVYLAAMTDASRKKVAADLGGRPVLVITEEDFECEVGSMFCLSVADNRVSFRVNLDSVARSGIHIHPGVLQLGRRRGAAS
ncbi:YfiR family protein [Cupriavidus sp. 2TAF22]|uniref:YfiR family protein n=1 Tax=unclassified Cupriavidus TaxID=2640874 RepID=UPI003F8FBDD5